MYCKKCGSQIHDKAKFCPKCGAQFTKRAADLKKKKRHRITALLTSLVLLIGACGGVFVFRDEILALITGYEDVYSVVDDALDEYIVCETFQNADLEERREIAGSVLENLEESGDIAANSIVYDEESELYTYNYTNGAEGMIVLNDFSEDLMGTQEYIEHNTDLKNGNVGYSYNLHPEYDVSGSPYVETDLDALIIDSSGFDDLWSKFENEQTEWTKGYLETDLIKNITVEQFKTALIGYEFISIRCHGAYERNGTNVCLNEMVTKYLDNKYEVDLNNNYIFHATNSEGTYYWLHPSFFTAYYSDNKLDNAIIWLSCCDGYRTNELVSAFADCGANAVIGSTESVLADYEASMLEAFVFQLLCGNTVVDSLAYAKSVWGENDHEYARVEEDHGRIVTTYTTKDDIAEFRNYNGDDATLVTLTDEAKESISTNGSISGIVTDESGNPIEGATVTAVSTLSDTLANKTATTGADGSYEITCDAGNYKLKVTADGYDDYESDDVLHVETKVDTLVDTIVLTVPVEVPDIVQAVLENTELITEILTERQESESNVVFDNDIHGENQIWFQDMDMDGDVEFIVRVKGIMDGGPCNRPYRIFDIDDNGNLYNATIVYNSDYGVYEVDFCDNSDASLWYDQTKGEYCYLLPDHGYSVVLGNLYCLELDENGYSQSEILSIYDEDYPEKGCQIEGNDDDSVSYAEAIAYYDAYFENLIGYQTTVQKIRMEDYVSMSNEEKLAVLTESYNAWSYTEDDSIERPLADVIDALRDEVETTESAIPNTAVQWNGSSYQLFDNVVDTYEEAAAYCESLGGHLAIIGSNEENDYLYDYVTNLGYVNVYFGYTDKGICQ